MTLDRLALRSGVVFEVQRHAYIGYYTLKGNQMYLIKPTTFMNLSGKAIHYWLDSEKIPIENLLVITDDLALPFGTIRLRTKGSHAGHNGLKNIDQWLNNQPYARLRIGIGNDFPKGRQVEYVLGRFTAEQESALPTLLDRAADCVESFVLAGPYNTMNTFNSGS